jgi:predicted flap endonuclease-1-like 5' DNA nuclease
MLHYLIELAVWMLLAYFAGCCIGCLLRQVFGSEPALEAAAPAPLVSGAGAAAPSSAAEPHMQLARPRGIAAAREGKPDDLLRISGVGSKNEKILHSLGIFHYDQIANWNAAEVNWVDDHLKFNGRIRREEWIKQTRLLADGDEVEFARLYGSGGLSNKAGEKTSGTRTRRT